MSTKGFFSDNEKHGCMVKRRASNLDTVILPVNLGLNTKHWSAELAPGLEFRKLVSMTAMLLAHLDSQDKNGFLTRAKGLKLRLANKIQLILAKSCLAPGIIMLKSKRKTEIFYTVIRFPC